MANGQQQTRWVSFSIPILFMESSELMRLFLCEARRQNRSIVSLCEDFGDRRLVQKELIRTIF